jgi:hypothetical protein
MPGAGEFMHLSYTNIVNEHGAYLSISSSSHLNQIIRAVSAYINGAQCGLDDRDSPSDNAYGIELKKDNSYSHENKRRN